MLIFNYSTTVDPLLREIRVYVPEFSGMKAGDKVLDVCCGTGDQVFYYAKRGIIATGVDLNLEMIKMAKKDKRKKDLKNVSFQIADASSLPFKDNSFDYASISFALHEKERAVRDKIISEMKRVVKSGGNLIFIDFQVPLPKNLYSYLIKTVEYLAGRDHFRSFKDYLGQRGLDGIVNKNQLQIEKRENIKSGIATIIKAKNI
jgi:ubiquinone/menaquinone biosynthesis C-methylase UbiE